MEPDTNRVFEQNMADFRAEWIELARKDMPPLREYARFSSPYPALNEAAQALFSSPEGAPAACHIFLDMPADALSADKSPRKIAVFTAPLAAEAEAELVLETPPLYGAGLPEGCGVNDALLRGEALSALHVVDFFRLLLDLLRRPRTGRLRVCGAPTEAPGLLCVSSAVSRESALQALRLLQRYPQRRFYDDTAYEGKLRALHQVQLKLLLEFDRVCRAYGILYFIAGGTLLGAARERGFIPWDDDIDVCMDRPNYERLCAVAAEGFGAEYFFQTYETDPSYCSPFAKLRLKGTRFSTPFSSQFPGMHNEIFIDVFIHDAAPGWKPLYKLHIFLTLLARSMVFHKWSGTPMHFYGRFPLLCRLATRFIQGRSMDRLKAFELRVMTWWNRFDTAYRYDPTGTHTRNGVFPASLLSESVAMDFEAYRLPGPVGYDAYLRFLYGPQYMQWPRPGQRCVHHEAAEFSLGACEAEES